MLYFKELTLNELDLLYKNRYTLRYHSLALAEDAANRLKAEQIVYDDSLTAVAPRYYVFIQR